MSFPLHALLISDRPAESVLDGLRRAGYDPQTEYIATLGALAGALDQRVWDVVLVCLDDATLSVWDMLGGLQHRSSRPPLIAIGDSLSESESVALIREGVRDIVRTSDLGRLGVAVAKAVRSQREERTARSLARPEANLPFHTFAEHMPIGLYRSTEDGRILYANRALAQMLGHDAVEEMPDEPVTKWAHYPREEFVGAMRTEGEVRNFELSWSRPDGTLIVTRENARAVRGDDGTLLYYEGAMEDITEERRALHLEQRRAQQFEAIARFRAVADAAGGREELDAAMLRSMEDVLQADAAVVLQHSAGGVEACAWSTCIAEGMETSREQEVRQMYPVGVEPVIVRDEEALEGEPLIEPMRDAMRRAGMRALSSFPLLYQGEPVGALVALFREPYTVPESDLSMAETLSGHVARALARWRAESEFRDGEALLHQSVRSLAQQKALNELSTLDAEAGAVLRRTTEVAAQMLDTGRVALWLLNDMGHELRCHDIYERSEGHHRTDESFRGDAVADALEMLAHQRVLATTDVLNKPLSERIGLDVYHARNDVQAVLTAPLRRGGRIVGFVTFEHLGEARTWTQDEQDFAGDVADLIMITLERGKRARAEVALRKSEARYRFISDLASDYAHALTVEADGSLRLVWATDAFERISGYTIGEVHDLNGLIQIVHEEDRSALKTQSDSLQGGGTVEIEMRIITKSGDERWIWHRSHPVRDGEGRIEYIYSTGKDITERKRVEAALVAAREEAEALAQQKSDFLASMSHEIRTPLTGIIGFAGVLAEEANGEHREFARLIEQNGRRLVSTLNSVLDLAKLESGGLESTPEPLDVIEEVRQVVLLLSPLADDKGIGMQLRTDETELVAPLDIVCLHRILNNLIGNAIKFTDSGQVTIEVASTNGRVEIDVVDSGIGIDEDFLPHLFDEFRQEAQESQDAREGGREGSGLGLAITKKLVERMEGTIHVESEKGEGSRFALSFPTTNELERWQEATGRVEARGEANARVASHALLAPDDGFLLTDLEAGTTPDHANSEGDAAQSVLSLNDVSLHVVSDKEGERYVQPHRSNAPITPSADASDAYPCVLVIEENLGVSFVLERILGGAFSVDRAMEARDALDRMGKKRYDAIMLDVDLGGSRCGVDVLRVARTLSGNERTVAVALLSDTESAAAMREAGFDHCISKPFTEEKLLATLGAVAKREG